MWNCKHCSEQIENDFDSCWNCGYSYDGIAPDADAKKEANANKIKEAAYQAQSSIRLAPLNRQEVVVVDVRMPFLSMVVFMVTWAIACIPALLVLISFGALGAFIFR